MYCVKCNAELPNDCVFCPNCGAKQEVASQQAVEEVETEIAEEIVEEQTPATKKCVNCGSEMPLEDLFCIQCGTRQEEGVQSEPVAGEVETEMKEEVQPEKKLGEAKAKLKKPLSRKTIIGIAAGAVALIAAIVVGVILLLGKPSVDLNEYVTVTFDGYDTVGRAEVSFDYDKFAADHGEKMKKTVQKSKDSGEDSFTSVFGYYSDNLTDTFVYDCVSWELDKYDNLSNGDIVTLKWDCNDKYAEDVFGYEMEYSDIEFEVTGLQEVETFDPFDGINVTFEGVTTEGYATVKGEPTAEEAKHLEYSLDKSSDLSNGDTVNVSVYYYYGDDAVDYCYEKYGKIPSPTVKKFTVEGLNTWVATTEDISKETMADMKKKAESVFDEEVVDDFTKGEESLESLEYLGNYFLTNKNSEDSWDANNKLYLVYKAKVRNKYSNDGKKYNKVNDIYWYINFDNLNNDKDGKTKVDLKTYDVPYSYFTVDSEVSEGWFGTKSWYYYGYETTDDLYNDVVKEQSEEFNAEENVTE